MPSLELPIRAATETAIAHGITPDRCDILQNGSTLVLRLTDSLVARVVQDAQGPRQGTEWFARENAIALHLTRQGAPTIPLHPDLPPGPHEHLGYPMNFWQFVTRIDAEPNPAQIGSTLHRCHEIMRSFPEPLPALAIITESLSILQDRALFPEPVSQMLRDHLSKSLDSLGHLPHQPLHGDAHLGNLMNTTTGLLWTDWEDTFAGPIEWDVASVI
ncbi:MAG: phosphotransferase [Verrucomicrobiaceae bacterium]|nr:phosphotransferase [Verrucomicrobiaceae bacterium]